MKRRKGAPWTLAELERLGKTADSVLARRIGRTSGKPSPNANATASNW
jgi:hypothetical protein